MTVEQNRDDHQYETPSQGAWQPIETAPKDGTQILAFDKVCKDCVVLIWSASDEDEDDHCWRVQWNGDEDPDCKFWMPLPAPPHRARVTDDPLTGTAST